MKILIEKLVFDLTVIKIFNIKMSRWRGTLILIIGREKLILNIDICIYVFLHCQST